MKAATKFYFNHYQLHSEIVLPLREVTARDRGGEKGRKRGRGRKGGRERKGEKGGERGRREGIGIFSPKLKLSQEFIVEIHSFYFDLY